MHNLSRQGLNGDRHREDMLEFPMLCFYDGALLTGMWAAPKSGFLEAFHLLKLISIISLCSG